MPGRERSKCVTSRKAAGKLYNNDFAELLPREAEREKEFIARAFRRASRKAFLRPERVVDLAAKAAFHRTERYRSIPFPQNPGVDRETSQPRHA